jgi:CubicO group peptidase (beta-lactamase class C family)
VDDAVQVFAEDSLEFEPGTAYLYSSYGYELLGCVIEGASGMTYIDFLTSRIFQPAGMQHTREDDPSAIIEHRAAGYLLTEDGQLKNCRQVDMSNRLAAGGFVTTAEDLAYFAAAEMDGTLINRESFEKMLTPQKTSDGTVIPYGLGWGLFPDELWYGEKEAFHGGSTPGASGMLYLLPDRKFAVAFMTNLEGVERRTELAAKMAKVVLDLGK